MLRICVLNLVDVLAACYCESGMSSYCRAAIAVQAVLYVLLGVVIIFVELIEHYP